MTAAANDTPDTGARDAKGLAALALLVAAVAATAMASAMGCGSERTGTGTRGRASESTMGTSSSIANAEPRAARSADLRRHATVQSGRSPRGLPPSGIPSATPPAPGPPPGTLPQTHAFPSSRTQQFKAEMAALWSAIVTGSAERGLAAFFPEQAYVRLKAIASASADWRDRLVHELRLDLGAAHALLGAGAADARLLSVRVPSEYGHWVEPGTCFNGIGYYEVPNARIVYRESGRIRSIGIASMISWRGQWYVVHLGAVLRSSDEGVVDEPSEGVGASVDSGTC